MGKASITFRMEATMMASGCLIGCRARENCIMSQAKLLMKANGARIRFTDKESCTTKTQRKLKGLTTRIFQDWATAGPPTRVIIHLLRHILI